MALQSLMDQNLLIAQGSRPQTYTPHCVGLLWTRDRPVAETSMPAAGFEPATLASERSQTHALDRTATVYGTIQPYN